MSHLLIQRRKSIISTRRLRPAKNPCEVLRPIIIGPCRRPPIPMTQIFTTISLSIPCAQSAIPIKMSCIVVKYVPIVALLILQCWQPNHLQNWTIFSIINKSPRAHRQRIAIRWIRRFHFVGQLDSMNERVQFKLLPQKYNC